MTFTYNEAIIEDKDKVRFYLQDTAEGSGPKPNNGNFEDEEITGLIAVEGTWQRAVAAGFETLASAWQRETTFSVFNGSFTRSDAAEGYRKMAKIWRDQHGGPGEDDDLIDSIGYLDVDSSGDAVAPIFQREAFGNRFKDWDSG